MPAIELPSSQLISKLDQPVTALHLIIRGQVRVKYPGGEYTLGKGDIIGICEVCSEVHYLEYETIADTTMISYPHTSYESLSDLLSKNPDLSNLFLISIFRQITILLNNCAISDLTCSRLSSDLTKYYDMYQQVAKKYRVEPGTLKDIETVNTYISEESPDEWLNSYYLGLVHIFSDNNLLSKFRDPAISMGFIRKGSLDFHKTYLSLEERFQYQNKLFNYYFDDSQNDLFELYTSLYFKIGANNTESESILNIIENIISYAKDCYFANHEKINTRIQKFQTTLSHIHSETTETKEVDDGSMHTQIAGSMNVILNYAGMDSDFCTKLVKHINSFKAVEDKNSTAESVCTLRKHLTASFYNLYETIVLKSLKDTKIPVPVQMFLYYGYIDEELAGEENCNYLYKLLKTLTGQSINGVYTFYDWLVAIYNGEKDPSRNEFDEDYDNYVHKQRASGSLTNEEIRDLQENTMHKVLFELHNIFPSANKVTYGRVTTFCPFFASDSIYKSLSSSYVSASVILDSLEKLRAVDFTLFYRETMGFTIVESLGKEQMHIECLPDSILMPNIGTRGVMWQEIEGRKRNSPSRMIYSIFHMEDLNNTLIRLAGEYRWEMCKRIQSTRWNDVSVSSLTSEYFDYVQFYRKNNELTAEAKERVKTSLQRARNSFKEMFVRDYQLWVLFEASGSPRLNKVARRILFTYCPFSKELRDKLNQNPTFAEFNTRYKMIQDKNLYKINILIQRLNSQATAIPTALEQERDFWKM